MPKLISFDIGIKNLAYCIFETSPVCKIIDWNVLDISREESESESDNIIFCSCFLSQNQKTKNKKTKNQNQKTEIKCKKKAKYQKDNHFFCESHAKKSGFFLPTQTKQFSLSFLKKLSLEKLLETELEFFPENK